MSEKPPKYVWWSPMCGFQTTPCDLKAKRCWGCPDDKRYRIVPAPVQKGKR